MAAEPRIELGEASWLLVLSGAGISAESGLATFRGDGGLWRTHRFEHLASPEGFAADPKLVWEFYSDRRDRAAAARPNAAHLALARAEQRLGERYLLATQNVDGLHHLAGSRRCVELHGNLFTSRCSGCAREPFEDRTLHRDGPPRCDRCGSLLRPHIVWFGEALDPICFERIEYFLEQARGGQLSFLAVGTSGVVWPAAGLVVRAGAAGARTFLVNAEPAANTGVFDVFVQGASGEVLPHLFSETAG